MGIYIAALMPAGTSAAARNATVAAAIQAVIVVALGVSPADVTVGAPIIFGARRAAAARAGVGAGLAGAVATWPVTAIVAASTEELSAAALLGIGPALAPANAALLAASGGAANTSLYAVPGSFTCVGKGGTACPSGGGGGGDGGGLSPGAIAGAVIGAGVYAALLLAAALVFARWHAQRVRERSGGGENKAAPASAANAAAAALAVAAGTGLGTPAASPQYSYSYAAGLTPQSSPLSFAGHQRLPPREVAPPTVNAYGFYAAATGFEKTRTSSLPRSFSGRRRGDVAHY